jgi:ribosomal protein S13
MKLYQKGIQQLKMSREQRLKELTSQKVNLVDLAQQLSSKNVQSEVAEEIERLSKERDEQLKKMLDEGHLHGVFEDV